MGHSSATTMLQEIVTSLHDHEIDVRKVVQVSMDCPNVNWKLHRLIMEHMACNMNLKEAEDETKAVKKRMSLLEETNTHLTVELDFLEQYSRQNCLVQIIMGEIRLNC